MTIAQPEVVVKRAINPRPLLPKDTVQKLADVMKLLGGVLDEQATIDEALTRMRDDLKKAKSK